MRFAVLPAAVGFSLSTVGAGAAEITEAEFLSRLTDDHPASVVLTNELAVAEGDRRTPRTENIDLSFEREAPEDAPAQSTLKLSWRPPLDSRRGLANKAAEAGLAAAERQLVWKRLRLREQLRELYARWSLVVERRDLFADLTKRIQQLASRARARASTGEESGLNARRMELAAAEGQAAAAEAEVDVLRIHAELGAMFPGLDPTRRPVPPSLPSVSTSFDLSSRADLEAREHEAERAELAERLAGRYVEFPALVGGWTVFDEDDTQIEGPVLGVEWSIPLFDRRQGERARARREADIARARLELSRARAAAEFRAAKEVYKHLRIAAGEVLESTAGTEAVVQAATAEFQAGESTLTDLLETLRSVTDSRLAALAVHQEALAAHRRLEMSVGRPLTEGEPQ
jgi:outer membrane protein TolC